MEKANKNNTTIVEAVGAASAKRTPNAHRVEQAMSAAVMQARKDGIKDPAEIRARMLEAAAQARQRASR